MKLSRNQFEILSCLERNKNGKVSQRLLAGETGLSVGTVNSVISELDELNFVKKDKNIILTMEGLNALEPYRVKRAVFLAAGFGSRMVPLTFNTPKPLIKVHGKSMIETLLDACVKAEINEIYIVVGYLGEYFEVLKNKYKNITFIWNELYNDANNISSALVAKDYLCNAYVLEADLVLYNDKLIRKYEYDSNFLGMFVDRTDDWCFETKKGIITEEKVGGENCYQMVGISYYNEEDGKKLAEDIPAVFNMPGGKEKYWEQVQLVYKKNNYKIRIRECQKGDIVEIDSFRELKQIDKIYDI